MEEFDSSVRSRRRFILPVFILICGLAATVLATYLINQNHRFKNQQLIEEATHQVERTIQVRMEAYVGLLRGGAGLFAANPTVTLDQFRKFHDRLEIEKRYPGLQGFGYSVKIPPEKLDALVANVRRQGLANFDVWPKEPREQYHAIVFLEPQDKGNQRALGYDMFTSPSRRAAMEAARDHGNPRFTGKLRLVQELQNESGQPGFIVYFPVYLGGNVPDSETERRNLLQGFIYSPFRAGDLFQSMFPRGVPGLSFAIWDGGEAKTDALLYQSHPDFRLPGKEYLSHLEISGASWTLGVAPLPGAMSQRGAVILWLVPALGIIASILLSYFTQMEGRARARFERTANELFNQREWLQVTLASIGDGVISTDTTGRIQYMNGVAEQLTGWKYPDAQRLPLREVFVIRNEVTGEPSENPAAKVIATGEPVHLADKTTLIDRNGVERSIDDSAAPIRDRKGGVIGVVLVFREISERRRYERRSAAQHAVTSILAESPSLAEASTRILSSICEQLKFDLGVLWVFDKRSGKANASQVWHRPDARLESFGQLCLNFKPGPGEGLPGRVWSTAEPAWVCDFPDETQFALSQHAAAAGLRTGFAFPIEIESEKLGALEFFSRENMSLDPELLILSKGIGAQIGQFIQRKNAENSLAQSEELYRSISETAADGIVVIDQNSRILTVNGAMEQIFGYSSGELVGQSLKKLMPSGMHSAHDAGMKHFFETGQRRITWSGMVLPGLHKDGREIPLEISFGMAKHGAGYLFTGLVRDITERKKAEEAIRELNQELENRVHRRTAALQESKEQMEAFSYTVAHDLRAPLRAMQGFAHALLDDYGNRFDSAAVEFLQRIMSAAHRMDELIQDLLAYSQLSRSDLTFKPVFVREVVENALRSHEEAIQEANAVIRVTVDDLVVRAHPATLENVLGNLIANAIKFTKPKQVPRITIRATSQGSIVRISVQDNGIGIAPEHHERVFRVFERLHAQEAYPGTGIGLAIVRKGVERMGGTAGIDSEPGQGSTFWIELPMEDVQS